MTNCKMDMIASIADCYSKGTLGAEDAYLLTVRMIEGSLSVIELLHILAKMEGKPNVGRNHDCDALYEAYHKGFFEGYKGYKERKEEEKKEAEKIDKKKVIDEMNEAVWNEFKNCFGGIE